MTVPQITTFLTVPDSTKGRAIFVAEANQFGHDLTPLGNETNAVAVFVNEKAVEAAASESAAESARDAAQDAATAAQTAALAAADDWQSGGNYAKNDLVWGGATSGRLFRCIAPHSGISTPPESDPIRWAQVLVDPADVTSLTARMTAAEAAANQLLDVPIIRTSSARTLALGDRGRCISTTANVTIPANSAVAFPIGTTIIVRNVGGGNITIGIHTDTLRLSGSTKAGARTLAPHGTVTLHKDAATVWYCSGVGVS